MTTCRRTLRFKDQADQEVTLRRLRWWCVSGSQRTSRQQHLRLPYNGPNNKVEELPSLAELDVLADAPSSAEAGSHEAAASSQGPSAAPPPASGLEEAHVPDEL